MRSSAPRRISARCVTIARSRRDVRTNGFPSHRLQTDETGRDVGRENETVALLEKICRKTRSSPEYQAEMEVGQEFAWFPRKAKPLRQSYSSAWYRDTYRCVYRVHFQRLVGSLPLLSFSDVRCEALYASFAVNKKTQVSRRAPSEEGRRPSGNETSGLENKFTC